jgi:hypothetical protein
MRRSLPCLATLVACALATSGCGPADDGAAKKPSSRQREPGSAAVAAVRLPEGLVVRGEPSGTHVAACKASAKQGDEVTIVGRIGGSRNPFVSDAAVFTIVDPSLKPCNAKDDDHCNTPWDYCCEDRDSMKRNMATIEIAGDDGTPLALPLRGLQGLDPLATVSVTGTVTERNDQGVLVVRAKRIAVQ